MPRKMEFKSPGVQAKDRAWKRQYIILHGTMIRIYKADPHVVPVPADADFLDHDAMVDGAGAVGAGPSAPVGSDATRRRHSGGVKPLHFHEGQYGETVTTGASRLRQAAMSQLPTTHNAAVRVYSLQNAESGLAADYLKRKHVVRVRAEGEQFLLAVRLRFASSLQVTLLLIDHFSNL